MVDRHFKSNRDYACRNSKLLVNGIVSTVKFITAAAVNLFHHAMGMLERLIVRCCCPNSNVPLLFYRSDDPNDDLRQFTRGAAGMTVAEIDNLNTNFNLGVNIFQQRVNTEIANVRREAVQREGGVPQNRN